MSNEPPGLFHLVVSYGRAAHIPLIVGSNSLVLLTFKHVNALDTPDNYAIAALATSDLFIGFVYVPLALLEEYDHAWFNTSLATCVLSFPFRYFLLIISISFTMLLTLDRYVAIVYPFYYHENVTNAKVVWTACALWLMDLGLFVGLTSVMIYNFVPFTDDGRVDCGSHHFPDWLFVIGSIIVYFQLGISVMATFKVAVDAWRSLKNRENVEKRFSLTDRLIKVKKQLKMTLTLNFCFVVLILPGLIGEWLIREYRYDGDIRTVRAFCNHFLLMNSSVNAFVYALSRPIYRISFAYILTHPLCQYNELSNHVMRARRLIPLDIRNSGNSICSTSNINVNTKPKQSTTIRFNKRFQSAGALGDLFQGLNTVKRQIAKENRKRKKSRSNKDNPSVTTGTTVDTITDNESVYSEFSETPTKLTSGEHTRHTDLLTDIRTNTTPTSSPDNLSSKYAWSSIVKVFSRKK